MTSSKAPIHKLNAEQNGHGEDVTCSELVDKDHNGKIDASEKKALDACMKGKGGKYDMNGDGHVSANELKCGIRADKDFNGVIDRKEVAEFRKCLRTFKVNHDNTFNADFDGNGISDAFEKQFAKLFDMNNDGKLGKDEMKRAKSGWELARKEFVPMAPRHHSQKQKQAEKEEEAYDEY